MQSLVFGKTICKNKKLNPQGFIVVAMVWFSDQDKKNCIFNWNLIYNHNSISYTPPKTHEIFIKID